MRNGEMVLERLRWEDWSELLAEMVRYAEGQMRRRVPGCKQGLVLVGGHDANDVASGVVADVLTGKRRVALGWTRARLEAELERQVCRELRRLWSRKEAGATVSEWAVLPRGENGERHSIFDDVAGGIPNGYEEAARKSEAEEGENMMKMLEGRLDGDTVERGLLECLRQGVVKRREIAAKLGVDVRAVTAARKRLERKANTDRRRRKPNAAGG